MNNLFAQLTGSTPYPFQKRVAEFALAGSNIFLCAPTGSGKTWAALLPYIIAKKNGKDRFDRLIYVLPLRSLATTLYNETVTACQRIFDVKNLPEHRSYNENEIVITIQTGEQKDDPFLEGDIIFTTVDQCLSSYINMPVSLPHKRLGNINAGALLGSLIVFDEFHLLEADKAMGTAIEMLDRLKPFSQFIIMTATLATKSIKTLQEILAGQIVTFSPDETLELPSHKHKKRTYLWVNHPISADDIIAVHTGKRSIAITNTVARAQSIFIELKEKLKDTDTKILLLHSRFYKEDRKHTEEQLSLWFGKDAVKTNVILVTTQVVEAGIDISADNLHTELAPLNSIVQRAGRCARYAGERGVGTVWVYDLPTNNQGKLTILPYDEDLVVATRELFIKLPVEGHIFNFSDELSWLDIVHTESETPAIQRYNNLYPVRTLVNNAMDGQNDAAINQLIRDASSINIIISDTPYNLCFDKVKWPRMLSVPRSSLFKLSPFFEQASYHGETVAWYPVENSNITEDEGTISFGWEPISEPKQIMQASWLIVINPNFTAYSHDIGLQIGVAGEQLTVDYLDRPCVPKFKIIYETYFEHVEKVLKESFKLHSLSAVAETKLANQFAITLREIEKMTFLTCSLHDTGKLSTDWQRSIRQWQQFKNPQKLSDEPIAHSDYDPDIDFYKKQPFPRQPTHSAEGAFATAKWLIDNIGEDFAAAIWTAITRHHGAFTESLASFKLIEGANQFATKQLSAWVQGNIILNDQPDNVTQRQFKDDLLKISENTDEKLWPLYVFLVRRIRLADQKSQKGAS